VTVLLNDISQITVSIALTAGWSFLIVFNNRDESMYGCLELLIGTRPCQSDCVCVCVASGKAVVHFLQDNLFLIQGLALKNTAAIL